jgi:hypothetical protein
MQKHIDDSTSWSFAVSYVNTAVWSDMGGFVASARFVALNLRSFIENDLSVLANSFWQCSS